MKRRVAIVGIFVILSMVVSTAYAGNVIVRNGQLNVSGGFYSNSDTLHVDSVNNRVGIGTTSPSAKLDVEGNIDLSDYNITDVAFISGGGDAVNFADDIDLSINDLLLSDPIYNSSILLAGTSAGTNKPALAINVQPADPVNENAAVRVFRSGDVKDYGEFIVVEPNVGTIRFRMRSYKAGQGTSYLGLENATNLYVDGNVGIGTVSPSTKLHLDFDGAGPYTNSTLAGTLYLESGGSVGEGNYGSGIIFGQVDGNSAVNVGAAIYGIQTGSDSNEMGLGFDVHTSSSGDNRSNAMVIDHNGNVGIGTTGPASKLHLNGSGSDTMIQIENSDARYPGVYILNSIASYTMQLDGSDGKLYWYNGSSNNMVLEQDGKVGIGTVSPVNRLEVFDDGAMYQLRLSTGDSKSMDLGVDGNGFSRVAASYGFGVVRGATEIMRIGNNDDHVGIGTILPASKLHVSDPADNDIFLLNDSDGSCEAQPESGGLTWSCSSDARLKTDIRDAADALDYVCGIPIRDYTVIASGDNMTGVVAQEVLEDYPELVSVNMDGYYMVSEVGHWKLVKALQDLRREKDAEIDELTELNEELISLNERLMEELCERDSTYTWCLGS